MDKQLCYCPICDIHLFNKAVLKLHFIIEHCKSRKNSLI